ncbi:hypothetical protein DRB41_26150 [Salmonella enterica]|nr:hypothetical protein [Salmonella enterica]
MHIFIFSRSACCLVSVRKWLFFLLPLSGFSPIKSGWRPCVLFRIIMIFIVIFVIHFVQGSIKGPKKT